MTIAYELSDLPDMMRELSVSRPEDVLDYWRDALKSFWAGQKCTLALRLVSDGKKRIRVFWFIRSHVSEHDLSQDVERFFKHVKLNAGRVSDERVAELGRIPEDLATIGEVRQREELADLGRAEAYVVYPFRSVAGVCHDLVRRLGTMRAVVSLYMQPTSITDDESSFFQRAATACEKVHDMIGNAKAKELAELYRWNFERFTPAFLVNTQILTLDPRSCEDLGQSFGESLIVGGSSASPAYALIFPGSDQDRNRARASYEAVRIDEWGPTEADPVQKRMRYLVDADGASAVFRLPIAVNGQVPGIAVRAFGKIPCNIFLSYRRSTSQQFASHLYARFKEVIDGEVFYDLYNREPGEFQDALEEKLDASAVLFLVVSDRMFKEERSPDFVHEEIVRAHQSGKTIIPLLEDSLDIGKSGLIPDSLEFIRNYNAVNIYHKHFDEGFKGALEMLRRELGEGTEFTSG